MRISDWSSDVCSSDLRTRNRGFHVEQSGRSAHACGLLGGVGRQERLQGLVERERAARLGMQVDRRIPAASGEDRVALQGLARRSAGRIADRERLHTAPAARRDRRRSEEQPSEIQSLIRISYSVSCLKNKKT